jgi:hypothetical protein
MSSGIYFLGVVGMINSLRVLGHREPIFLLDCGLAPGQRELVEPHVTLVPGPPEVPPYVLKTIAPLRHPAEVMVLIDADIVATRSLAGLIAQAREGRVIAPRNDTDRFVPEWGELLGLGSVRRQPYLSSGLVFLGPGVGEHVLALMASLIDRVRLDLTFDQRNDPTYPFFYMEQDVLNAILASRVERDRVVALPHRLVPNPPFPGLRRPNEATLRCAYRDGTEPYALHHFAVKPWLEPTFYSPYSRLLRRLLIRADVPVRVREGELPLRMRTGPRAWVSRTVISAYDLARWYLRDRIPAWFRNRNRLSDEQRPAAESP